jgi:hypothetical protein
MHMGRHRRRHHLRRRHHGYFVTPTRIVYFHQGSWRYRHGRGVCWVDRCRWCDDSGAHIDEAQVGGTRTTSYIAIFVSQFPIKGLAT